ncbi:MAG: acyl-CoA thioesterase [Anaerolineae bacterium]
MDEFKYRFFYPMQVRFAETDAQGHVFFGEYFTYFDESMMAYFQAIGCSWQDLLEAGIDTYYVDAGCQYKSPAYFGEMLHIHARMRQIGNTSFSVEFAILKENSEALVATGHITAVTVNKETGQPLRVPERLRDAVAAYEANPE